MDHATKMAIRALVSGLHYAATIDQRHIAKIIEALNEAIEKTNNEVLYSATQELSVLRDWIARDAQLDIEGKPLRKD